MRDANYPYGAIAARGEALYLLLLRNKVEPKHKGKFLTISGRAKSETRGKWKTECSRSFSKIGKNMPFPTRQILPITLVLLFITIGCDREGATTTITTSTGGNIEILTIGPYTETCQGFIEQTCFLEFNAEKQQWEFFYESIQGFDFEPGFIYTLKVRLEDRGTEIQDVGRYAYYLVEVISKEKASVDERPPRIP